MAAAPEAASPATGRREPNHALRIAIIWVVLALAADLLIYLVWGPHLPPGTMSSSAASQQFDLKVISVMAAPVMLFVLTYFAYALVVWRHRDGDDEDGPALFGHTGIQAGWIIGTAVIVLSLFVFGTVELIKPNGAGAGEGPAPIWKPGGTPLQVQVIGQQWKFTYRYPQFGGFETTALLLPVSQWVEFHVTSIDVIHSFWAYQLGVKADANPGVDNVAYTEPQHLGLVTVRCAELCGLWHGAMFDYGHVVSPAAFRSWAASTESRQRSNGVLAALPPYATTYDPTVIPKLNRVYVKLGVTGAGGGYYPPQDPVQP
ncbi:MAG TPA: cytochrome c oxidase subunit II [Streptosporangiaceae bacterium]|nr:cytochrome c oxidase subunit II [Streptosporangiaceae bacterium]